MPAQKNKIAICLIVKNEPQMIPEYVDYYLKLGADTIIIYDNDSDTPVVSDNSNVIVNKWATVWPANQMRAYHDCALRYSQEYKWIGFFDSDEYVILKKHNNLVEFLNDYDRFCGVGINWVCFGSSGIEKHVSHKDYNRHCRFDDPINTHIKSFIKPEYMYRLPGDPHFLVPNTADTDGNILRGPFSPFKNDVAYLKHCIMRTQEDYLKKVNRGRADVPEKERNFRSLEKWEEHSKVFNECSDETKIWS
jgi:hypothetical protein